MPKGRHKNELPADFIPGFSLSARRANVRRTKQYAADNCPQTCAGGNRCVSTTKFAHSLHLCKSPDCECHRQLRKGSGVAR